MNHLTKTFNDDVLIDVYNEALGMEYNHSFIRPMSEAAYVIYCLSDNTDRDSFNCSDKYITWLDGFDKLVSFNSLKDFKAYDVLEGLAYLLTEYQDGYYYGLESDSKLVELINEYANMED